MLLKLQGKFGRPADVYVFMWLATFWAALCRRAIEYLSRGSSCPKRNFVRKRSSPMLRRPVVAFAAGCYLRLVHLLRAEV